MKLGLWLLIGVVALLWFNHGKKQRLRDRARASVVRGAAPSNDPTGVALERMVACAQCGLHVPLAEAVVSADGTTFCCEPHRRLYGNA